MEVDFADRDLARMVASEAVLRRNYGPQLARKMMSRIAALRAVDRASDLFVLPGRWHAMTGDLKGNLSADLVHPQRLLVRPQTPAQLDEHGGIDWTATTAVTVAGIVDTH
jgi:plasmid maintenance system killer protein